jgi:hypothetical protein
VKFFMWKASLYIYIYLFLYLSFTEYKRVWFIQEQWLGLGFFLEKKIIIHKYINNARTQSSFFLR